MKSPNNSNFDQFKLQGITNVIDKIYGISIYDMISEKIHFHYKIPQFNYNYFLSIIEHFFRITYSEYKQTIIKEQIIFICKSKEYFINNRVKLNLTLINEVIICTLYNPLLIDEFTSKLLNQRLLETLIMISNTKMLKMELLLKKYTEVNLVLEDFMYMMDPRLKFKYKKNEEILARKAILHSQFVIKLKVGVEVMNEFFNFSFVKRFRHVMKNLENIKKLRCKIFYNSIDMELIKYNMLNNQEVNKMNFNNSMKKFYIEKKSDRMKLFNNHSFIKFATINNFNNLDNSHVFSNSYSEKFINDSTNVNINAIISPNKINSNPFNNFSKSSSSFNNPNIGDNYIDVDQLINNVKPYITKTESQSTGSSRLSFTDDLNKSSRVGIHRIDWTRSYINKDMSPPKKTRNSKSLEKTKNTENELNKSGMNVRSNSILNNSDGFVNSGNIRHNFNSNYYDYEFTKIKNSFGGVGIDYKKEEMRKVTNIPERVNKFAVLDEGNFKFDKFNKLDNFNKFELNDKLNFNEVKTDNKSNHTANNLTKLKISDNILINNNDKFKNFDFTPPEKDKETYDEFTFELEENFITELNKNTITTIIRKETSSPIIHNDFDPSIVHSEGLIDSRPSLPSYESIADEHSHKDQLTNMIDKKTVETDQDLALMDLSLDLTVNYKRVLNKKEDVFNPVTIKNNLIGSINEKGRIVYKKGKFEEVEYKGQIRLELLNKFEIKNKILYVKIFHDKWKDLKSFKKEILDDKNIELINDDESNIRVYCRNVKDLFKILTYNIDKKVIDTIIDFKYNQTLDINNNAFNLKLDFKLIKKNLKRFKNCNLTIILTFNSESKFTIDNTKKSNYKHDHTNNKITYNLKNFLELETFDINLFIKLNSTHDDKKFLQTINLKYLYEDFVLSFNSIDITYQDEFSQINHLNIIKRCLYEEEYHL